MTERKGFNPDDTKFMGFAGTDGKVHLENKSDEDNRVADHTATISGEVAEDVATEKVWQKELQSVEKVMGANRSYFETRSKQGLSALEMSLKDLTADEINEEIRKVNKAMAEEIESGDRDSSKSDLRKVEELKKVVDLVRQLSKADAPRRQQLLEKIAKESVFLVNDVNEALKGEGKIGQVVKDLLRTVENLVMAKFPEDFKKQERWREEETREWITQIRERDDKRVVR